MKLSINFFSENIMSGFSEEYIQEKLTKVNLVNLLLY